MSAASKRIGALALLALAAGTGCIPSNVVAADDRWVDRVVIAVQPHVMVRGSRSELRQPVTGATGGSGNIPARSTSIRSVGAQPNTRRRRSLTSTSQSASWALKSAGEAKLRPGRNEVSR